MATHKTSRDVRRFDALAREIPTPLSSATYAARQAGHLGNKTSVALETTHPAISPLRRNRSAGRRAHGTFSWSRVGIGRQRGAFAHVHCRRVATRAGVRRDGLVLVVMAPPDVRLVASPRRAVEPLIHAPEAIQTARIGWWVDHAVLERERAHARPFAGVGAWVGSRHARADDKPLVATPLTFTPLPRRFAPVVVFDASPALLLLGEPDAEVEVKVAAERRGPWKSPVPCAA